MPLKQLPYLGSALAMAGGLYLLAGPFRNDRGSFGMLLGLFGILLVYEFVVIGMIAVLRRAGIDTRALAVVSLFFLLDPVFFGDAFISTHPQAGAWMSGVAWGIAILKAWSLSRALDHKVSPWLAGWAAAALGLVSLFPWLHVVTAAQPASYAAFLSGLWAAAALAVPLVRSGAIGRVVAGGVLGHAVASAIVASLDFDVSFLTPPLIAAAGVLPWPRWGWTPLGPALLTTPLRPKMVELGTSVDGIGVALIAAAFGLLAWGFLRSLRARRFPIPDGLSVPENQRPAASRTGSGGAARGTSAG